VLSPLFILGIYYQLIAQIAGIALGLTLASLLLNQRIPTKRTSIIKYGSVCGLLSASLCVTYPEITPFIGIPILAFPVINFFRFKKIPLGWLSILFLSSIVGLVLLRENVIVYLVTILTQSTRGTKSDIVGDTIFPYFLLPTGLSSFAGFSPINLFPQEPKATFYFVLGLLFIGMVVWLHVKDLIKLCSYSLIGVTMLIVGGFLFIKLSGFGLFKLSMFIQPMVAIALSAGLTSLRQKRFWAVLAIIVFLQSPTWTYYGKRSHGQYSIS
jgi:hypothetical protein